MDFKTGVLLDSFRLPLDESLHEASEAGADGVQMFAVPHEMAVLKLDFADAEKLKRKLRSSGLEMASLCGDIGGHGFENKFENKSKIKKTIEIIDYAVELGTTIISTHIGVISENDSEKRDNIQEALIKICRYAEKSGVLIAVETGPEKSEVLKKFILETGEKSLKVNFDPANLVMVQGEDPVLAVYNLNDLIVHTHAKDGKMIQKCDPVKIYNAFAEGNPDNIDIDSYFMEFPIGKGDVNFPAYLAALDEIGYKGYLTIEREAGENRVKDVTEGIKFLKGVML
ncbi:MAG: sugar phosphate isomerase/epimerase [Spirochaetaceae bacterium]|nr:sugar phosphate isomerase/epimerase [Spirochaetaceae bacterium]